MNRRMVGAVSVLLVSLLLSPAVGSGEERKGFEFKPVLLVMDVQNVWLPMMAEGDRNSAPAKISEAIALFRKSGAPVVVVYHSDPKRGPAPGTEPYKCPDWVAVTGDDPTVIKAHPSAFTHTDLDALLKKSGRNTVFICGLSAAGCALATYFGALDRDYMAFMIEGALLSHDSTYTDMVEDFCDSVSLEDLAVEMAER